MKKTRTEQKKSSSFRGRVSISTALLAIVIFVALLSFGAARSNDASVHHSAQTVSTSYMNSGEDAVIADNGNTDFTIILYGSAPHANVSKTAVEISNIFYSGCKVDLPYKSYSASSPDSNVIVYGRCDIELSTRLADEVDAVGAGNYSWGIAYENGVLALYANSKLASEETTDVFTDMLDALRSYISDGKMTVPNGLYRIFTITEQEYQRLLDEKSLAERDDRINALKEAIGSFTCSDFDPDGLGITTDMSAESGVSYGEPYAYPMAAEHPRVLFTKDDIPGILAALEDEDNEIAVKDFLDKIETSYTGVLDDPTERASKKGNHNYDYTGLAIIQSKAFAYAIYGDEEYGYQAILAMLNYIKTLEVNWMYLDLYREYGYVMYTAACVYDWCYDLLTEEDKANIVLGIEHQICRGTANQPNLCPYDGVKMEIGFPPSKQSSVSGHGCEQQLLRDYLSFAIAIFDEYSGWYEFIGGRFYNQFVEPRNVYYASGLYPQGTSYNAMRFQFDLYSAALIKTATGKNPYDDDIKDALYGMISHITNISTLDYYKLGDVRSSTVKIAENIGACALITSYLYADSTLRSIASLFPNGYTYFSAGVDNVSATEFIIWSSSGVKENESFANELPLITYYGGFVGQIISRNSWTEDSCVVLMKIQERTTANHDHAAAGSFQIYYKGILTGDMGDYTGTAYSSTHCKYFLRATVAHNGLLIYNTDLQNSQEGYYSGGQRINIGEASSYDAWQNTKFDTATLSGYAYGYEQSGDVGFSYLAGDITKAYDAETVNYVGRSMLTVYTNDEDCPMLFFVFDRIDAKSESFKKTFLLQIPGENAPVIDEDGKTVTVTNGEGKLKLFNLIGGDTIEGVGGTAEDGTRLNYQINGQQVSFIENGTVNDGNSWGRVEISANLESKVDNFLNIIAVTDADKEIAFTPKEVNATSDDASVSFRGASVAGVTALFADSSRRLSERLSFTTEGAGLMDYYIGGLYSGTWTVSLNGESLGTVYSTGNAGLVHFTLPAGDVTLTPGDDIRPTNSGVITYITNGGNFEKKPLEFYPLGTETEIPTNIIRENDTFLGWFEDAEFTKPVTAIPSTAGESYIVYAKWSKVFVNENYEKTVINSACKANEVQYAAGSSSGVAITDYKYQTDGNGALIWSAPVAGTHIYRAAGQMENNALTYEFEFAKNGENTPLNVMFRFREDVKNFVPFLYINEFGQVLSGDQGYNIFNLSDEMQTVRIVVDFEEGLFTYYTDSDNAVYSQSFSVPKNSTASSTLEFQSRLEQFFNIYGSGTQRKFEGDLPSIKIGKIILSDGDTVNTESSDEPESEHRIVYNTGGGFFSVKPSTSYIPGETKTLATNITKQGSYFVGWYSDEAFTTKVTEVPTDATGEFAVYAKWISALVSEDYSITILDGAATKNKISYAAGKSGDVPNTNYTYKTDGNGALIFGATSGGSYIKADPQEFFTDAFTYEIELAKNGDNTPINASFRIREGSSTSKSLYLFYVKSNGRVLASDNSTLLFTLAEDMIKLSVTVDFANGMLYYALDDITVLALPFSTPSASAAASTKEWQSMLDQIFNFVTSTTEPQSETDSPSIKIGCIKVFDGALVDTSSLPEPEPEPTEKIVYNTNGGSFDVSPELIYNKGEITPLDLTVKKDGYVFIGWYADKTLLTPVSEVPEDAEGAFEVYAKWFKKVEYKNDCNTTAIKTINLHECSNHTAENADGNGICKTCGYCTELNSASCPFYTKPTSAKTCTICGKDYKKGATLGVLSGNDGTLGYGKSIQLDGGGTPVLTVISSSGTHLTVSDNLYGALFDENGNAVMTKLVLCIDLGIPTTEQAASVIGDSSYTELPDASKPMNLGLRLGKSGYYSEMLFRVVNGSLTFTSSANDAIASLPVGSVSSFRIELDFSDAVAGDGLADKITVSIYDGNGNLLGSAEKSTATGHDISEYCETLFQIRAESGGAILIDNIHAYAE